MNTRDAIMCTFGHVEGDARGSRRRVELYRTRWGEVVNNSALFVDGREVYVRALRYSGDNVHFDIRREGWPPSGLPQSGIVAENACDIAQLAAGYLNRDHGTPFRAAL